MVKIRDLPVPELLSLTYAKSAVRPNILELLGCAKLGWFLPAGLLRAFTMLIQTVTPGKVFQIT